MLNGLRSSVASRSARGMVRAQVLFSEYNYHLRHPVPTKGARGNGIRFERKVVDSLTAQYSSCTFGVPIRITRDDGTHLMCIPDAFMLHGSEVVVFEVKIRHCIDAWWQLTKLYEPALRRAFGLNVRRLEVVKSYDPAVSFPEPHFICQDVNTFLKTRAPLGVLIWGR